MITTTLGLLAAVNAIFIAWATALDARHASALARALGATPQQVSAGLSAAQVLPALAGAILGIPGGIGLVAVVDPDAITLPPLWQLLAVVLGTVVVIAALTAIPARIGARRPAARDPPIRTRMMLRRRLLLLAALAATATACGGDDGDGEDLVATTATAGERGWEQVVPGGDCQCSDGSEFSFWVREANPKKVVVYLQGGGACWSAKTCAPGGDLYDTSIGSDDAPTGQGGIFDFADKRNPFADYSVVYVPYCTGDVHIGNATTEYAPGLTVHHKGYVNGRRRARSSRRHVSRCDRRRRDR